LHFFLFSDCPIDYWFVFFVWRSGSSCLLFHARISRLLPFFRSDVSPYSVDFFPIPRFFRCSCCFFFLGSLVVSHSPFPQDQNSLLRAACKTVVRPHFLQEAVIDRHCLVGKLVGVFVSVRGSTRFRCPFFKRPFRRLVWPALRPGGPLGGGHALFRVRKRSAASLQVVFWPPCLLVI